MNNWTTFDSMELIFIKLIRISYWSAESVFGSLNIVLKTTNNCVKNDQDSLSQPITKPAAAGACLIRTLEFIECVRVYSDR